MSHKNVSNKATVKDSAFLSKLGSTMARRGPNPMEQGPVRSQITWKKTSNVKYRLKTLTGTIPIYDDMTEEQIEDVKRKHGLIPGTFPEGIPPPPEDGEEDGLEQDMDMGTFSPSKPNQDPDYEVMVDDHGVVCSRTHQQNLTIKILPDPVRQESSSSSTKVSVPVAVNSSPVSKETEVTSPIPVVNGHDEEMPNMELAKTSPGRLSDARLDIEVPKRLPGIDGLPGSWSYTASKQSKITTNTTVEVHSVTTKNTKIDMSKYELKAKEQIAANQPKKARDVHEIDKTLEDLGDIPEDELQAYLNELEAEEKAEKAQTLDVPPPVIGEPPVEEEPPPLPPRKEKSEGESKKKKAGFFAKCCPCCLKAESSD